MNLRSKIRLNFSSPSRYRQIQQICPWNCRNILLQIPLPSFHPASKLPGVACVTLFHGKDWGDYLLGVDLFWRGKWVQRADIKRSLKVVLNILLWITMLESYSQLRFIIKMFVNLKPKDTKINHRKTNRCNLKFCCLFKCPALPSFWLKFPLSSV